MKLDIRKDTQTLKSVSSVIGELKQTHLTPAQKTQFLCIFNEYKIWYSGLELKFKKVTENNTTKIQATKGQ